MVSCQINRAAAAALDLAMTTLRFEPTLSRRRGGARRPPRLGRLRGLSHQRDETLQRIVPVAALGAEPLRGNDQHAIRGDAISGKGDEPRPYGGGEIARMGHIKPQLHCRGDLVDILAAGAGGANETLLDFALVQRDAS